MMIKSSNPRRLLRIHVELRLLCILNLTIAQQPTTEGKTYEFVERDKENFKLYKFRCS